MRRIHQIPFQAILQRRVCDFTAREAQGHKYRSLWADLSDESAPIGAYDPRSIWNHFIPHPNVAVLVCDRCRIIAPTSHAKASKLNVSGEAILRKRSWPRDDNWTGPIDRIQGGVCCAWEEVLPNHTEGDHSFAG